MNIANDTVVTFHYVLKDENGNEIESSLTRDPMAVLIGHGNILLGVEEAIMGKAVHDKVSVTLPPEKAYGLRRENSVQRVPIKHITSRSKKLMPGSQVIINTEQGGRNATVIKVGKFNVDVDTNHPLAGKTIHFDISIVDIRAATAEEISHRHAHGAGGHHH